MKKTILYFIAATMAVVAVSCSREQVSGEYEESVVARLSGSSRFAITDTGKSVWNTGDSISVFVDGGDNEVWNYAGTDASSSGEFKHVSRQYRFSSDRINAVYPSDASLVISGDLVPVCLSSEIPLLAASCDDFETLNFHYLTSLIRLSLDRKEDVDKIVFRPNGDQTPGGTFSIDFSSSEPSLKQDGALDSLVFPGRTDSCFTLNVPAGNYEDGFDIVLECASGYRQTIRHTGAVDFKAGEVLDISAISNNYTLVLNVDFRDKNPFEETFPTNKINGGREDKTFTLMQDGGAYKFAFHPGYYEYPETDPQGRSGPEYGYARALNTYFSPSQYGLTIGRADSFIKLPAVAGKNLVKFEYLAGNSTQGPYLAKDSLGVEHFSKQDGTAAVGDIRTIYVDYLKREENTPYFVYVTGGNFLLLWYKAYYQ